MPPPLQPFVQNVPLTLAKNLRWQDDNGLWVTQLFPIGTNDSPTTGYISRIGAKLSDQIDLYNTVQNTLNQYQNNITELQQAVDALEISGSTIPVVNGYCFSGNANVPITDLIEAMAQSDCQYIPVIGTPTALINAIQAEGATALNAMPSYSIPAGIMQALTGWIPNPQTLASSLNNLWLSYLDSRTALTNMLKFITPSCSNNIIDFGASYLPGSSARIGVYFSGYTFIPSAYTDMGSTITITDAVGSVYTTAINLLSRSQPGADPLFVGISGTPLNANSAYFNVTLKSNIGTASNTCTKTVTKTINNDTLIKGGTYQTGSLFVDSQSIITIPIVGFVPTYVDIVAMDVGSMSIVQAGYYIDISSGVATVHFTATTGNVAFRWVAFK